VVKATDWSDNEERNFFGPLFISGERRTPGADGTYRFCMKCLLGGNGRRSKKCAAC
jgi:hypothetical protein